GRAGNRCGAHCRLQQLARPVLETQILNPRRHSGSFAATNRLFPEEAWQEADALLIRFRNLPALRRRSWREFRLILPHPGTVA
ncbi:MAG TPA: hypothetical protein PLZ16_11725, partial [Gammaproteobacteria bacterium]|nr:hypothetical protein [Gammaproteobacteria bacterium]